MVLCLSAQAASVEPPANRIGDEDEVCSKTFEAKKLYKEINE
jgi:hypothetical protein